MCLISVSNLKEIHPGKACLKVIVVNWCEEEEKGEENWGQNSSYRDMRGCKWCLAVPVNNTLVCCTSFWANDT